MPRAISWAWSATLALASACGPQAPAEPTGASTDTGDVTSGTTTSATPTESTQPDPTTTDPTTTEPLPDTSTGDTLLDCATVCDAPRTLDGDLHVTPATDPASLHCLREVTGDVDIRDFTGPLPKELRSLQTVGGLLQIFGNDGLVALDGLECVRQVRALGIDFNDMLVDLGALSGLTSSIFVFVTSNDALVDLSPLSNITDLEFFQVQSCDAVEVLPSLAVGTRLTNLYLWDCAQLKHVDALAGIRGTPTQIDLSNLPQLTSIAGLAGLWGAEEPPGELALSHLPKLGSLTGLEGLSEQEHIGGLLLDDLPQLTSLAPLAGARSIGLLMLSNLPALKSLTDLAALKQLVELRIGSCSTSGVDAIVDLSGLGAVTELDTLRLTANASLTSLEGLTSLALGPTIFVSIDNPKLPPEVIADFAATHAIASTCQQPPDMCECF